MIDKFDRATVKLVSERVRAALAGLAEELGCDISAVGGTYESMCFTAKVKLTLRSVGGLSADEVVFRRDCGMFGLRDEDYNAEIEMPNGRARIVGIQGRRSKRPIVFEFVARPGKRYVCPAEYVRRALGRQFEWEK